MATGFDAHHFPQDLPLPTGGPGTGDDSRRDGVLSWQREGRIRFADRV